MLANIILPAFSTPWLFALGFPIAALVVIVIELLVFKALNQSAPLWKLLLLVLAVNVVSTIMGFVLTAFLPSGYEVMTVTGENGEQDSSFEPGPRYVTYAFISFPVALVLSVLVEYGMVWTIAVDWRHQLRRMFKTVALANVASYTVLSVVALLHWLTRGG